MFIREVKNRSGSVSIQIISKDEGKYKVIASLGSGQTAEQIAVLKQKAHHKLEAIQKQSSIFVSKEDTLIESFIGSLSNNQIQVCGPEIIFGKVYEKIGFSAIEDVLFRHLVISRLAHPGSKLNTVDYLLRYQGISIGIDRIYRFLDKLNRQLKGQVEQIAFSQTMKILRGNLGIIFYDMTTLHFQASSEDDLRKTGFSKEGKHQLPQIYLGLLVSLGGYPIGYDIFEGNIYEGHTLIPILKKFEAKFNLSKPIVIADAGLLSDENITQLQLQGYNYILGARIKNESEALKNQILGLALSNGQSHIMKKDQKAKLIISYSDKRAIRDEFNRKRGLRRLEKSLRSKKFTKSNINNRGYNKYLKLTGDVTVEIDYERFELDKRWDGLKGYLTNSQISADQVIENYNQLWQIEKAFRISKTDLKIRPIYHRLGHRIDAHICVAFTAYTVYKEVERLLYKEKAPFSVKRAAELTQNMYRVTVLLPESKNEKQILLKMDVQQQILKNIIDKNC